MMLAGNYAASRTDLRRIDEGAFVHRGLPGWWTETPRGAGLDGWWRL